MQRTLVYLSALTGSLEAPTLKLDSSNVRKSGGVRRCVRLPKPNFITNPNLRPLTPIAQTINTLDRWQLKSSE